MPNIDINIFARLHEATLRRTERDAQKRFQELGQQAADDLTKGIETAAPKIRRAMNSAADASVDYARKTRDLAKAQQEQAAAAEKAAKLEQQIGEQRERNARAVQTVTVLENGLSTARKEARNALADVTKQEQDLDEMRRAHDRTVADLRKGELELKQLRLDGERTRAHEYEQGLMALREQNVDEATRLKAAERALETARETLGDKTVAAKNFEQELSEVRKDHAQGVKDLESSEKDLAKTRETASRTDTELVRLNEEVERSTRKREESIRRLAEAEDDHERRSSRRGGGRGSGVAGTLGNILTDLPFVPSGPAGAGIGAGVVTLLGSVAQAAVTASQSMAALPAVLTAAGAGFGTLMLGMDGFDKTIKAIGDDKKFAQTIQGLAPAAQQAALEIRYLVQGPLKELKDSTQGKLFDGVAEQLHNLTNQFLPEAEQLTGGIATTFNNMFKNFTGQLQQPGSHAAIDDIINNIVTAFQKLEPAVAPVTDAITKIIQTGSSFLPGFANAITHAAQSFDNFITKAQANGSLHDFIQKGIDAAVTLGKVIWELGQDIFKVFGNKDPEQFKQTLEDTIHTAETIASAIVGISQAINEVLKDMQPVADAFGGWKNLAEAAGGAILAWKTRGVLSTIESVATGLGEGPSGVGGKLAAIPALAKTAGLSLAALAIGLPAIENWADKNIPGQSFLNSLPTPAGLLGDAGRMVQGQNPTGPLSHLPGMSDAFGPSAQEQVDAEVKRRKGLIAPGTSNSMFGPVVAQPPGTPGPSGKPSFIGGSTVPGAPPPKGGLPDYSPFDVPPPPATGPKESEKDRRDKIRQGLNVDDFMPALNAMPGSPGFSVPGANGGPNAVTVASPAGMPPLQFGTNGQPYQKPGLGYTDVDPKEVSDRYYDLQKSAREVRDARINLAVLEKDTLATQQELQEAREKVADQEHSFYDAQLNYQDALQGKWKKVGSQMSSSMNEIGAHLDRDLGLSKGLSGLADNLVRFLGNLATAPIQQMLQNIIDAHPNEGSGIVGILAAQGAFGPQFTPQGIAMGQGGSGGGGFLSNGLNGIVQGGGYGGGGGFDAALLANVPAGKYDPSGDLAKGLGDCSSAVEDLVNIMDGRPTAGREMTTLNEGEWLTAHGFQPGMGGPGDFRVGFNAAHTQATLPGGTPFNWGSKEAAARGGIGGTGADDPAFTSHYYRPVGPSAGLDAAGPLAGIPQAVQQGAQQGVQQGLAGWSADWNAMAQKESGGNWQENTGNGHFGGLQFSPSSWQAAGGTAYAQRADQATPYEQAMTAENLLKMQGPGAWPNTFTPGSSGPPMTLGSPAVGAGPGGPGLYSPENTNPALNNPPAPASLSGGIPAVGGGQAGGPGPSLPIGTGLGASPGYQPTQQPQSPQGWQPGAKSSGGGGIIGAAAGAAAGMFPGGGAAAQIAMQMIQRTIQYGGEVAGSLAKGAMDFFSVSDPDGGPGASIGESWLGRLAGSIASAAPALPSSAGKMDKQMEKVANPNGQQPTQQGQKQGQNGPLIGTMNVQADKATGQQMATQMQYASAAAGLIPPG